MLLLLLIIHDGSNKSGGDTNFTKDPKQQKQQTTFCELSPPWNAILTHSFWHTLWKYIWHTYSDILSGIYFDILSDILSGIYWHTFWHLFRRSFWHSFWHLFRHSLSTFFLAKFSGIYSDVLSGILSNIFWLSSGTANGDLSLAVEVRHCPLRFGARSWRGGGQEAEVGRPALIKSTDPHLAGGETS